MTLASHPAYPSRAELAREQRAEAWIADQMHASACLRTILTRAVAEIGRLDFPLGSPVRGYDVPDIAAALRDLLPVEYERDRRAMIALSADAYERAALAEDVA